MFSNKNAAFELLGINAGAWIVPVIMGVAVIAFFMANAIMQKRKNAKNRKYDKAKNKEAAKLYRKAKFGGAADWYNMYLFAYERSDDKDIYYEYRQWHEFLERAAKRGHPEAMCKVGQLKLLTDRAYAMGLLEKAAEQGVDKACLVIAQEYAHGLYGYFPEGMEKMSERECAENAAKWLLPAAERGCSEAQTRLGDMLRFHLGDERGALEWYLKAAEKGDSEGQLGVARIYGKRKEFYKAQKYYRLSAEQGNTYAQLNYAEMLLLPEIFYDKEKAVYWLEQSAKGDNPLAIRKLAAFYRDGDILEQDTQKCVYWLEKGAKIGDDTAAYDIGVRYLNGDGVKQDYKKAIKYLKFSAGKYNDHAMVELGFCYLNGVGVEKNLEKAEKMFERAVKETDNARAKEALETYFNKL